MFKINNESSKKYDPFLATLAHMVCEDFEFSYFFPVLVPNATPNNITHPHMF